MPLKATRGGARPNSGPKAKPLDLGKVEELAFFQSTDEEISYYFNQERSTITHRKQSDPLFAETLERGKAKGRLSLRRKQFEAAMDGDRTMLVWLGKNCLGQTDRLDSNVAITAGPSILEMSDEQLQARILEAKDAGLIQVEGPEPAPAALVDAPETSQVTEPALTVVKRQEKKTMPIRDAAPHLTSAILTTICAKTVGNATIGELKTILDALNRLSTNTDQTTVTTALS